MSDKQPNEELAASSKSSRSDLDRSTLLELNPQLKFAGGVFQNIDTQIRESRLSSYIQGAVNDSLDHSDDHSLHSTDIEKLLLTDELRSAFSAAPVNFLLSFDFNNIGNTLDLTQGFGGTTHFLADKVANIDCVRIDLGHARLSAKRCSAFNNINYVSEDIAQLTFPEKYYDLIVISQLESLELEKPAQASLLENLNQSLSDQGRIVISAKNRDRLSKWVSKGADAIAYKDLYLDETNADYNEAELNQLFTKAGFAHTDVYASFSAPLAIQNIFSKQYLNDNQFSLNHFSRLGGVGHTGLNEYLLFKNLARERGEVFGLASRFVMIAGASSDATQKLCNNDFAHYSGLGRQAQWRTTTQCKHGTAQVTKTLLHKNHQTTAKEAKSSIQLSQKTDPQVFETGLLLLDKWLAALLEPDPVSSLKAQISDYLNWLKEFEKASDFSDRAYDALPFNIIVDAQGAFKLIDPEWSIDAVFEADFVLFRALFWFAFENKALFKELAKQSGASTIGLFVLQFMDSIDSLDDLSRFVAMEEIVQRQIGQNFRNKSIKYALLQTFDGEPVHERLQPACQVSWSDKAGIVDEQHSVFILWMASTKDQNLIGKAPLMVEGKHVLRVDPIASMGIFKFSSIKLRASDGHVLWEINSTEDIINASEGLNVSPVTRKSDNGSTNASHFIALNEDPHFLFDLSNVEKLQHVESLEITFALIHNQYYDNALATLSQALSEQNVALGRQLSVLDTKQAEIDFLSAKLENIDHHRQVLQASIHTANHAHEAHVNELNNTLQAQFSRIQQLENNLMFKVFHRIKRAFSFLSRG